MFEFIAQQAQGIAAAQIAAQTPTPDSFDNEIAARYPHLSAKLRSQLADFDRRSATGEVEAQIKTQPTAWIFGSKLDYFLSTGAVRFAE